MSELGSTRGRARDAERTREVILNAAEAVFAEHGFDGARIDAIAKASGYNPSLLFQYFGDKLGLYTAVLKRADQEASVLSTLLFAPLLADETIASDAHKFRTFLKTAMGAYFDYMAEDMEQLEALFSKAQRAGLLRSDLDVVVVFLLAAQICWSFPTALPFYQLVLPGRDFSSAAARARAREQIIEFIVAGMMADLPETK